VDQIRTILVVDDDSTVCEAVTSYLSEEEYRIVTASRWTEAIAILQEDRPDAMLLDLHLPTVQGEALLEFIRESDRRLPVVIISTDIKPDKMARLGELGASGFIRKPFETDDLLVVLEQVLVDLSVLSVESSDAENAKADDLEQNSGTELGPGITPGAGIYDLSRQPTSSPLETTPGAMATHRRRRSGKKRGRSRKTLRGTWIRKLRNFVLIIVFFLLTAFGIYVTRSNFGEGFAGITF